MKIYQNQMLIANTAIIQRRLENLNKQQNNSYHCIFKYFVLFSHQSSSLISIEERLWHSPCQRSSLLLKPLESYDNSVLSSWRRAPLRLWSEVYPFFRYFKNRGWGGGVFRIYSPNLFGCHFKKWELRRRGMNSGARGSMGQSLQKVRVEEEGYETVLEVLRAK